MIRYLTDERIKEIAVGLVNGQWFCTDQMPSSSLPLFTVIFLPINFMKQKTLDEWKRDKVIHMAAPLSASVGGRAINGYPIFAEVTPLPEEDYRLIHELEMKMRKAMKQALEGTEDGGQEGQKEASKEGGKKEVSTEAKG